MKFKGIRDGVVAVCFLLLMLLIAIKVETDAEHTFSGRYRVVDGDSLAMGDSRYRLRGLDAPELSQICMRAGKPWRCGEDARRALALLVGEGEIDCKGTGTDKYRRWLVTCFAAGIDVNREMVVRGMAVTFGDYDAEERKARDARLGLWASDFERPADWRQARKAGFDEEAPHVPGFIQQLFGGEG